MKIALKADGEKVYTAFGIYWSDFKGNLERYYNVVEPHDNLAGFDVLPDNKINIIDPNLDNYFMIRQGFGVQMLVHKAACPTEEFYDSLVNHDDVKNVKQLFQNIRDMGLEP